MLNSFLLLYEKQMTDLKKKITDYVNSDKFQDRRGPVADIDDVAQIGQMLYEIASECSLEVDFSNAENSSDYRVEATVYVKNLLEDERGYTVVVDCDFDRYFDTREDVVNSVYRVETEAQEILAYFKK